MELLMPLIFEVTAGWRPDNQWAVSTTADCVAGGIGRSEPTTEDSAASAGKFGEDVHLIIDTVWMVMR